MLLSSKLPFMALRSGGVLLAIETVSGHVIARSWIGKIVVPWTIAGLANSIFSNRLTEKSGIASFTKKKWKYFKILDQFLKKKKILPLNSGVSGFAIATVKNSLIHFARIGKTVEKNWKIIYEFEKNLSWKYFFYLFLGLGQGQTKQSKGVPSVAFPKWPLMHRSQWSPSVLCWQSEKKIKT